jgi:hypothetical protein
MVSDRVKMVPASVEAIRDMKPAAGCLAPERPRVRPVGHAGRRAAAASAGARQRFIIEFPRRDPPSDGAPEGGRRGRIAGNTRPVVIDPRPHGLRRYPSQPNFSLTGRRRYRAQSRAIGGQSVTWRDASPANHAVHPILERASSGNRGNTGGGSLPDDAWA